jgi:poly(A) polymerase
VKLLEHLRLRAGYDFLLLRCAAEEAPAELGDWWTKFMHGDDATREQLMKTAQASAAGGPRRRRRRGRGAQGRRTENGEVRGADS